MAFLERFRWVFENSVNCRFKEDLRSVTGFCSCATLKFFKEENRSHINVLLDPLDFIFNVEIRAGKELKSRRVFGASYICKSTTTSL